METEQKPKKTIDDFIGILNEYANPDLVPLEKEAWKMAVIEKHGSNKYSTEPPDFETIQKNLEQLIKATKA